LLSAAVVLILVVYRRRKQKKEKIQIEISRIRHQQKQHTNKEATTTVNQLSHGLLKQSRIAFNELAIERVIGEGSYGKVYLGKWNDAPVALKFCEKKSNETDFVSEIKVLLELPPHPNIVQMFGISLNGRQPIIVLEYCSGGSLDQVLFHNQTNQQITSEKKIEWIQSIARGVFHLHKHNIVHRDLAARNILLSSSGEPKISDFGTSRILEKVNEGKTQSSIGPVRWMAPESIATRTYSKKSDIWSFGIVVYEIVAQREPHKEGNVLEVAVAIRDQGLTPTIPSDCPPLLRQIMEMCWKKDPNERPNIEEVLAVLSMRRYTQIGY
jgi:serine/threonine protein kinase